MAAKKQDKEFKKKRETKNVKKKKKSHFAPGIESGGRIFYHQSPLTFLLCSLDSFKTSLPMSGLNKPNIKGNFPTQT
ncbi:hypothetical protein XENTR_v10022472 [Xenopus tropicalis]|nr:hypothetical protein XENTR_v10022472 [Xenopus tropicalis]